MHAVTIDLLFLFCALLSLLEGVFHPLFRGFVNMRLQSSCLLVTTIVYTILLDCHPVLSLTAFACKVAFSCLIDTGVILEP